MSSSPQAKRIKRKSFGEADLSGEHQGADVPRASSEMTGSAAADSTRSRLSDNAGSAMGLNGSQLDKVVDVHVSTQREFELPPHCHRHNGHNVLISNRDATESDQSTHPSPDSLQADTDRHNDAISQNKNKYDGSKLAEARKMLTGATALLIFAGAGCSCDCGLPDYSRTGWQQAHPELFERGLCYADIASPTLMQRDLQTFWQYFAQTIDEFREAQPHQGYTALKKLSDEYPDGCFVFTSNVDDMFRRAGFDARRIVEIHGRVTKLQCSKVPAHGSWSISSATMSQVQTLKAKTIGCSNSAAPDCLNLPPICRAHRCNATARPNILLFGDGAFCDSWIRPRHAAMHDWLGNLCVDASSKLCILEVGVGTAVPTVRNEAVRVVRNRLTAGCRNTSVVTINIGDSTWPCMPVKHVHLQGRAGDILPQLCSQETLNVQS